MTYKNIEKLIFDLDKYVNTKYMDDEISSKIGKLYDAISELKRDQDSKLRDVRDIVSNLIKN